MNNKLYSLDYRSCEWYWCKPYTPGEVWIYPRPLIAFRVDSQQHFVFRFVDIMYKPGYGFVAPALATTNGNQDFLKACLPEYCRPIAQDFFDFVKKTETDLIRQPTEKSNEAIQQEAP